MKPENRRFAGILICTVVGFFAVDFTVKIGRNAIEERRVDRVRVGMSEAEVIQATGREPFALSNGVKEIMVPAHDSVFDMLVRQNLTSSGRTIIIETGRVVGVNWTMIFR